MPITYTVAPKGAKCQYETYPVSNDSGTISASIRCGRSAVIRCESEFLGNRIAMDLCSVCYEQQRCEDEPHFWVVQ